MTIVYTLNIRLGKKLLKESSMFVLTGYHDGLGVPPQAVLEQPGQDRIPVRDEYLLGLTGAAGFVG